MTSDSYKRSKIILLWIDRLFLVVGGLAFIGLILQFGFYLPTDIEALLSRFEVAVVEFYLVQYLVKLFLSTKKLVYFRSQWYETILAFLIILENAWALNILGKNIFGQFLGIREVNTLVAVYVAVAQLLIVMTLIPRVISLNRGLIKFKFNPSQATLITFALAILLGGFMLMLPRAVTPGHAISFIDALFTSASAICVTGLCVVDTGSFFSPFGQLIILFLVQIGGLGIITINAFLLLFFGRGVGLQERVMLFDIVNADKFSIIGRTLKSIMTIVFATELIGALVLMVVWSNQGWSLPYLIFTSVFHSVCAFCNAGFSTFPDNLMSWQSNAGVIVTIAFLIIIGGIGFNVITDLIDSRIYLGRRRRKSPHVKLHTRLVVLLTLFFIGTGMIAFLLFEPAVAGQGVGTRLLNAFFTSVTARTAGFNSVDMGLISMPTAFVVIVLMFIGASPGSTGGGIKTTTFGVLAISVWGLLTGKRRIVVHKKNIPFVVVNRALIVFFASISLVVAGVLLLSITEKASFLDLLFETVSAFGTVGLSRNLTPHLTVFGKSVLIGVMFVGRIGILTLAFAITQTREAQVKIEYPSEMVGVG